MATNVVTSPYAIGGAFFTLSSNLVLSRVHFLANYAFTAPAMIAIGCNVTMYGTTCRGRINVDCGQRVHWKGTLI